MKKLTKLQKFTQKAIIVTILALCIWITCWSVKNIIGLF